MPSTELDDILEYLQDNTEGYHIDESYIKEDAIILAKQKLTALISREIDLVLGEQEKLVMPEFPRVDDEGEPLYSKRAASAGRKQVTARYHHRKELREEQRKRKESRGW